MAQLALAADPLSPGRTSRRLAKERRREPRRRQEALAAAADWPDDILPRRCNRVSHGLGACPEQIVVAEAMLTNCCVMVAISARH